MIEQNDINDARAAIAGRVHHTPLFTSTSLGERLGAQLFLKAENLQRTGSFKVRGVFNKIRMLSPEQKSAGLIAVSAGNHAAALAYAATAEGIRSTIVMPAHASPLKAAASRAYGAEIILHGDVFAAFQKMDELREQHGYTLVHPYDDDAVIAGQGTVGAEIVEDLPDVDVVVVPVGGGGLVAGIAAAVKQLRPSARVIGVEPQGAPTLKTGIDAGQPMRLQKIETIADGLAAPITGEHVLENVRHYLDDLVLVSDDEIADALREVLGRCKLLVEPAGAAAVAALLAGRIQLESNARVVAVLSGGNMDLNRLKGLLP